MCLLRRIDVHCDLSILLHKHVSLKKNSLTKTNAITWLFTK